MSAQGTEMDTPKPIYDMVLMDDQGHSLVGFVRNDPRRPDRAVRHIQTGPIVTRHEGHGLLDDIVETENSLYRVNRDPKARDAAIEDYLKQFKG